MPPCCRSCPVRQLGLQALRAGAAFYIMTSAKQILLDAFLPTLTGRGPAQALFLLCRYSLQPFSVGMLASGLRGWMVPFGRGDCRDYRTWLRADRGEKEDQTSLGEEAREAVGAVLRQSANRSAPAARFARQGNVLYPDAVP